MTSQKSKDIKFGNDKEKKIIKQLEKHLNIKLSKTDDYDEFDFINKKEKIIIELKSRRNTLERYPTTMIGLNKIKKAEIKKKEGYKVMLFFSFTDGLAYYKFKKINKDWIRDGGRCDRGKDEIKKYYYIPTNELINFNLNKKDEYNIKGKMYNQEHKTEDEKPLSYSQKLINYIQTNPLELDDGEDVNLTQIGFMINNFSKLLHDKRKADIDKMPFGKYKFKLVKDVAQFDKQYLKWLIKQDMMKNYEELKIEINKYL